MNGVCEYVSQDKYSFFHQRVMGQVVCTIGGGVDISLNKKNFQNNN